jgi:hypothetical protein
MFLHNACDTQTVCPCEKYEVAVLCFFRRGDVTLTCETRLNPDGPGYQMVITEQAQERIENFTELPKLLAREHDLLMAWRAQGWRDVGQPTRTPVDT